MPLSFQPPGRRPALIGTREFVALIASLMAVNALGIDMMLPALPQIAHDLKIMVENDRQLVIAAYMFGFGCGQIVYGPLADRFGRRAVLIPSLLFYVATTFIAGISNSFHLLVAARALQGFTAAASRILIVSIVRDRFSGREMAKVMSTAFIIFLAVPAFAPSIGQLVLLVAKWRWIFLLLAIYALGITLWVVLRLPESLHPEDRTPISIRTFTASAGLTLTNRFSIGYTLASTLLFGTMMGFINSLQQIFEEDFHAMALMTPMFAIIACFMAAGAFCNTRIVMQLGSRRVSHSMLVFMIGTSLVHTIVVLSGQETIASLVLLQGLHMGCFAMASSNFSSMAMEPMGHIAGTASSVQGLISTIGGVIIGLLIGQAFNGTTIPLAIGTLVCTVTALMIVLVTERGRLFHPLHEAAITPQ